METNEYVKLFNDDGQNCVRKVETIGGFIIDFDIFTEKNRYTLEKLVKETKEKQEQEENVEKVEKVEKPVAKENPSETSSAKRGVRRFERVSSRDSQPATRNRPESEKS